MSLTKVTSGAVSGLATSATTDTTDASNITTGTIPTARLDSTLDLSGKTVTLPAASVTAHATNPTKASIEALGIDASTLTGSLPAISGANLTGIETVTKSTTAPSSPAAGDMWFDTTTGTTAMKVWSGTAWDQMSNKFSATGGTESTYSSGGTNYKVHTFTSSGTFTAESSGSVDVLVVAGGGGSDGFHAGGGGAGGLLDSNTSVSAQAYTITIGGGAASGTNSAAGAIGSNSSALGVTAIRGGNGLRQAQNADAENNGGSGGGACDTNKSGGVGTSGQGNNGGYCKGATDSPSLLHYPTSGGGGAGQIGGNDDTTTGGYGGAGADMSSKYGTTYGQSGWFAGGGGGTSIGVGSASTQANYGAAGQGGGGIGGYSNPDTTAIRLSASGQANTGGGGGGYLYNGHGGGAGGSGIVIIRYAV